MSHFPNAYIQVYIHRPAPVLATESISRTLQSLRTVLAWHTSCRHIFKKTSYFQFDNTTKISKLCYTDEALPPIPLTIEEASTFLNDFRGPSDKPLAEEIARRILHQTWDAKVHAEAALMQWISSEYVGYFSLLFSRI